jgi:hypothetical protein
MDENQEEMIYVDVRYVAVLRPTVSYLTPQFPLVLRFPHFIVVTNFQLRCRHRPLGRSYGHQHPLIVLHIPSLSAILHQHSIINASLGSGPRRPHLTGYSPPCVGALRQQPPHVRLSTIHPPTQGLHGVRCALIQQGAVNGWSG